MRLLLNVIWVVLGGFVLWLQYLFVGALLCLFIVTIPWGMACFRIGRHALWPFGRMVVESPDGRTTSAVFNIVWVLLFGWWLALSHVIAAFAQAITIIGIPLAIANLKLVPVSLMPFGKVIVPIQD